MSIVGTLLKGVKALSKSKKVAKVAKPKAKKLTELERKFLAGTKPVKPKKTASREKFLKGEGRSSTPKSQYNASVKRGGKKIKNAKAINQANSYAKTNLLADAGILGGLTAAGILAKKSKKPVAKQVIDRAKKVSKKK